MQDGISIILFHFIKNHKKVTYNLLKKIIESNFYKVETGTRELRKLTSNNRIKPIFKQSKKRGNKLYIYQYKFVR